MGRIAILDNGHGGVVNGIYQTAGKRSPKYSKGVLYEGMFNRWVVNGVIQELDREGIPYYNVSPELTDVSLATRVRRINDIHKNNRNTWLLSIHANAGGGKGVEGFTTKGKTGADELAEIVLENLETDLRGQFMRFDRSDGDRDKESNYYLLRKSAPPAFLLECGFMDEITDYNNLWDRQYLKYLTNSLVRSIKDIYVG